MTTSVDVIATARHRGEVEGRLAGQGRDDGSWCGAHLCGAAWAVL